MNYTAYCSETFVVKYVISVPDSELPQNHDDSIILIEGDYRLINQSDLESLLNPNTQV
jgi:hypothetical protein